MSKVCRATLLAPVLFALFLCGCETVGEHHTKTENVAMVAPRVEAPQFIFHKVYAGETLATIARWYTGKNSSWRDIAADNPDLNPWNLHEGDVVKVSLSLATRHTEQPPYSTKPRKTAKKVEKSDKTADDSLDDEEVFGPK